MTKVVKAKYCVAPRGRSYQTTVTCSSLTGGRERRSFRSEAEADAWGLEQVTRLKKGLEIDRGDRTRRADGKPYTLQELVDWTMENHWKIHTVGHATIKGQVQSLIDTIGPKMPITKCDYRVITEALSDLEKGEGKPPKPNQNGTLNRKWSYLRKALKEAVQLRIIDRVPEIKKRCEAMPRSFRVNDELFNLMKMFAKRQEDREFHDFLVLALYLGAREGELLKITFSQSAAHSGYIDGDHIQFPPPHPKIENKGMKRRVLMVPCVKDIVERRRKELEGANGKIFPGLTKSKINKRWQKMKEDPQIAALVQAQPHPEHFVPHILRHEFCSRLGDERMSASEIMALSGHRSHVACLRYVHHSDAHCDANMRRLFGSTLPSVVEDSGKAEIKAG